MDHPAAWTLTLALTDARPLRSNCKCFPIPAFTSRVTLSLTQQAWHYPSHPCSGHACMHACAIASVMSNSVRPYGLTVAPQPPLPMGILQARILEWIVMPSSRGSSSGQRGTNIRSDTRQSKKLRKPDQMLLLCPNTQHKHFYFKLAFSPKLRKSGNCSPRVQNGKDRSICLWPQPA